MPVVGSIGLGYGLGLHLLVTEEGQPVGFLLTPGNIADVLAWTS
jgi:hypothetical protein